MRNDRTATQTVQAQHPQREITDRVLALLSPLISQKFLDRYHLRTPVNRSLKFIAKQVFFTAGATRNRIKKISGLSTAPTRLAWDRADYFDLRPTAEQAMMVDTVSEFVTHIIRPAAHDADAMAGYPADLLAQADRIGITALRIPESCGGIAGQRTTITNALIAEALAYGDMGLALPVLAPGGLASALTYWGSSDQQATYLPEFLGPHVIQGCVAIAEPHALFDPTALKTTAVRTPGGYRLDGVKSLIPAAVDAELFIVAAQFNGSPTLFIVEADTRGVYVTTDPGMGIRAAALGQIELNNVSVPLSARLGEDGTHSPAQTVDSTEFRRIAAQNYGDLIALSRLGWAALAVGTCHAVLDYVIPYVKQRQAFGEPIAQRQAVAFLCANMAIELDGLRLMVWRGASRAEQGLSFAREAALAKRCGTDKGMQIGLDGVQLLGGHGYTKEHPVERWYRDLRVIGVAEGVVVL